MKLLNDVDKRRLEIKEHVHEECQRKKEFQVCGVLYCTPRELEGFLQSHSKHIETFAPRIIIYCYICKFELNTERDVKYHHSRMHYYGKTCRSISL